MIESRKALPNRTSGLKFFLNKFWDDGIISKYHQDQSGDDRRKPILSSQIKKSLLGLDFLRTRRDAIQSSPFKKSPHTVFVTPHRGGDLTSP